MVASAQVKVRGNVVVGVIIAGWSGPVERLAMPISMAIMSVPMIRPNVRRCGVFKGLFLYILTWHLLYSIGQPPYSSIFVSICSMRVIVSASAPTICW